MQNNFINDQCQSTVFSPSNNLKYVFRDIRNYLAGNSSSTTRDEEIVQNVLRLLFCKIYDESNGAFMFKSCSDQEGDTIEPKIVSQNYLTMSKVSLGGNFALPKR